MKRLLIIITAALMALPAWSAPIDLSEYTETAAYGDIAASDTSLAEDLSVADFPNMDALMGYMFFLSYDGMRQGVGQGGLVAYTMDGGWISSWRMDGTPVDFLENLPRSTLVTPYPVPAPLAEMLFLGVGDIATARAIQGLPEDETHIMVIAVWKIYGEVVLKDPLYAIAERGINERISAHGLEPADFYASLEAATGEREMEFIARLLDSRTDADAEIEKGMAAIRVNSRVDEDRTVLYILVGLGCAAGIVLIGTGLYLAASGKASDGYNDSEGAEDAPDGGDTE